MVSRCFSDFAGLHVNALQWKQASLGIAYAVLSAPHVPPSSFWNGAPQHCAQPLTLIQASPWTKKSQPCCCFPLVSRCMFVFPETLSSHACQALRHIGTCGEKNHCVSKIFNCVDFFQLVPFPSHSVFVSCFFFVCLLKNAQSNCFFQVLTPQNSCLPFLLRLLI